MQSLLKNVSIYFLGNVFNRMMGFIIALIATHFLSRSDVGTANTLIDLVNIFLTIASVQIWMAIIRYVCDYEKATNKFKIISTGYFIQIITFIGYTLIFIVLTIIKIIPNNAIELFILSIGYIFNQNVQFACRGLEKNKLYAISGVFGSVVNLISFISFLFIFKLTYNALILSTACSYIMQGFFIEFFLKSFKYVKFQQINSKIISKMLKYSIPTTFNFISYWINQSANKIILTIFIGTEATGLFSTAYKMNSLIGVFLMAFNFAFQEFSFSIYRNKIKNKIYNQTFNYFVRFISCSVLILMPLTLFVFSFLVGEKYQSAQMLIPMLYLGCIFESLQNFLGSVMQAEKKVNLMFISQTIGAIITIVTMLIFVNFLGVDSAGIAMVLCYFTVFIIRLIALKPKIKIKFNLLYLIHYVPMFIITTYFYLNYSLSINILILILITCYCIFCTFDLIKILYYKITGKIKKTMGV